MDPCRLAKLVAEMRENQTNVNPKDLHAVCVEYFGGPRKGSGSHVAIFKMPWLNNPRVNIQTGRDKRAKPYQVKQVLSAIDKLEKIRGEKK
ncbi:toxin HicA [Mycobacterium heidelbergense]|nr:toxin HicA [Mycobacterium heidelbergense]BBZ52705.1 hypothetical protein MHEI_44220 [Mycobacterium heidelbergense]